MSLSIPRWISKGPRDDRGAAELMACLQARALPPLAQAKIQCVFSKGQALESGVAWLIQPNRTAMSAAV